MPRLRKVWDHFNRGEFGVLSPTKAVEGQFTAVDVLNYNSGLVGPRAGIVSTGWSFPAGELAGFGTCSPDDTYDYWCVIGTSVFNMYDTSAAVTTATGSIVSTPTAPVQGVAIGTAVYLSVYNDKLYKLITGTVSAMSSTPGGKCFVQFGERLMMANTGTATKNRVRYSAANDPTSWDSLGFFDVGADGSIVGMWPVRNQLWIAMDTGAWYVYTGVPGETDSLRLAYKTESYPRDFRAGCVNGLQVWYCGVQDDFPSYFNGNTVIQVEDLNLNDTLYATPTSLEPSVMAVNLPRESDLVFLAGSNVTGSDRRSLIQKNGLWTRHSLAPSWGVVRVNSQGSLVVSDGGGTSGSPRFWFWRATQPDRPPTAENELTDDGTEFVPTISLPEFRPDAGQDIRVNQVIVNWRKYSPEDDSPNYIDCRVKATQLWDNAREALSQKVSMTDEAADSDQDGQSRRSRFPVGDQGYSGGFQVTLSGLRGVALDAIGADYVETGTKP